MLGMTGSEEIMANGHSDYELGKDITIMTFKCKSLHFLSISFYLAYPTVLQYLLYGPLIVLLVNYGLRLNQTINKILSSFIYLCVTSIYFIFIYLLCNEHAIHNTLISTAMWSVQSTYL